MNPQAMEPFGRALLAYFEGCADAEVIVRRDDGKESVLPASWFFREEPDLTTIEKTAIDLCKDRILDIGAGTGLHSLILQRKHYSVSAIDVNPQAVSIMKQRGTEDAYCADVFEFNEGPFDTLLMMGHGIGMVENILGLKRFLSHARNLLSGDGQLLLDSLDVRVTSNPENLAYHETNRRVGRYIGEIRMQFEFLGQRGPFCGWLQVDAGTLREYAESSGWRCDIVCQEEKGNYLARLTRRESVQQNALER